MRLWEIECPRCGEVFEPSRDDRLDEDGEYNQIWFEYTEECPHCGCTLKIVDVFRFMTTEVEEVDG